ncbi:MAG: zinc ABC transporter substrate-binding protein [Alistipes sp.]|nr:zinc ABC transporter substrate-binding protein [Alistipes sp.]
MKNRIIQSILLLTAIFAIGCGSNNRNAGNKTFYVTIAPLKSIIEDITCNDFEVNVLVPNGASPETFEPTAKQIAALNDAQMIFAIGLIDFERGLTSKLDNRSAIVDLSQGIDILAGSCSHVHHNGHKHGIDPHIWTSPRALKQIAANAYTAVAQQYPDSTKYHEAYTTLLSRLDSLDSYVQNRLTQAGTTTFMIYHPAYTYYANDYGLQQIAIEHEGKEPTPRQLASLIDIARRNSVKYILYQPQYSKDKVDGIAAEIGAKAAMTDPLCDNIIQGIKELTDLITE